MACAYRILTPGSAHQNDLQGINGTGKTIIHSNYMTLPHMHLFSPPSLLDIFSYLRPTIKKNQKRKKKSTQRIMPAKRSVVEEADAGLRGRRSNGEISAAHVDHIELLSFLYPIPIRTFPNTFHNSITRSND